MEFERIELKKIPPEVAVKAIVDQDIAPYFEGIRYNGKHIKWKAIGPRSAVGKLSYFRNRHLSIFRFRVEADKSGQGSVLTLSFEKSALASLLIPAAYIIGLCIFLVGVVFAYIADKATRRNLGKYLEHLAMAIRKWEKSASGTGSGSRSESPGESGECPECGAATGHGASFCNKCGTGLV